MPLENAYETTVAPDVTTEEERLLARGGAGGRFGFDQDFSEDFSEDYDLMDIARAKKMTNDDKNWDALTQMMDFYNSEWKIDTDYLKDYGQFGF